MKKLIEPPEGYSRQVGILVCMLNEVRETTFKLTKRLTQEQLDFNVDAESNSIGTLLFHIAAFELIFQKKILEERPLTPQEIADWEDGFPGQLIKRKIHSHPLEYYWDRIRKVREDTLKLFQQKNDDWLSIEHQYAKELYMSNHFMFFHFFQDETSHQGQIKLILKKIAP